MSLVGKLVSEIEINIPAEKYYKVFRDEAFLFPNICPKIVQKIDVHQGDWENHGHGSIRIWNYTIDGKAQVFKERVEFDDGKLTASLIGLEGDVFNLYKTYKVTFQVVPKGPKISLAILTLEYEKLDDESPYPYNYLDLLNVITKDIESHLK